MSFRKFTAALAATTLLGIAGCSQGPQAAWDQDADGEVDRGEFYASVYSQWDTNQNGYVTLEEFEGNVIDAKLFQKWDEDKNSLLSFSEFGEALEDMQLENTDILDRYSEFDSDSNGSLDVGEFAHGFYNTWDSDADGGLTAAEFQNSMEQYAYFATLDSDKDGKLDEDLAEVNIWDMD